MAKQTWNNPIDKSVDWGGDTTTGGLPVSGEMVQRFIKESLNGKAGLFHYDTTNNRYLVFTDEDARDEYLLDPTKTELIIGTFDAPFNYSAEISLTSAAYNAVFLGSTGNYIDFTFDIKNKQGASTGENVTVTYTFIRNATRVVVKETRKFGDVVHFNVDKYLGEGTNTIMVGVTGQTSLAATTVAITYQVVNLVLTDETDISKAYNLSAGPQVMEVPFTVSGYGTKVVEWYLDGTMLDFVKAEDEVVDVTATRTKFITLSNLQQGRHTLQIRAFTVVNGENFYTDTLYRDILVYTGANTKPIVGVAVTIPRAYGVLGANDAVAIYDMVQYIPYTLRFATYSPTNASSTDVTITFDGEVKGVIGSANGIENEFLLTSSTSGNKTLVLQAGEESHSIATNVAETSMNLQEITDGLVLNFDATRKSNNSSDRDTWSYGDYTGTLTGFNWNNTSGWVGGRLEMNAGAEFAIDIAPLAGTPTNTGKTIEIEWSTKNVTNDDAVICDLRNEAGVGILITATKVSMRSADGVVVETEYKSDENVRVGFVVNRSSGTTNQRLSFIYANGIVSRGEKWAVTDSYASDAEIRFVATDEAEVSLKAIRIYNTALTSDQMLNNYTLYRDTVAEMMEVYDRNDVYEEGTSTFSPDKMMGRLPVMIVTGDIPTLENTSDKDTQIVVDIDYYNMQDTSKSFRMEGAAMRPQGTSSMGYPKKNFRIYTEKVDGTTLYDADGNVVENKLYSFKDGAQPVNCWCLKADYAESSGTHNTGIARLWNEALMNAQVDGEYVCRTGAQKAALEAGYPYDVRTTIDGFPILLFYRPTANDDVIFIGKYNFNNDKSTESVFGFEGIPNFDNSRMQCWEVLNNGNALALFTTVDGFDEGWSEAFESRYPDTKTPRTGDLKAFCQWMSSVSQEDFATEKWEHLNVYMMAAYWCYLMRHAGADQFVKNAMFTSEDGQKFYYILYDNDTINGLINTGRLRIKPTDDRQTVDEAGAYVFAGHDSRLWNMLEADEEFKNIVSAVDNALYSAGISYANTIRIFDEEQADKWVEKVYNQDAQYKYVGPYVEKGIDNLFMLQGKRDLHRRWWLAKRFSIYDAKYVSGTYKSQAIELKCINGTPAGQGFTIVAGYPLDYGFGINNVPREFGVSLEIGDSHTFTTEEVVNLGDPIRIYGAPNIAELDLSEMASKLAVITIANVYDDALGTKFTKFVVGKAGVTNAEVTEISGLKQASSLEYLDVQGMTKIISLDLANQPYFKTLKAFGSGVASVTFAKGAPVTTLELPSAMRVLALEQLPYLTTDGISLENIANLSAMTVLACPNVSNDFDFVYNWVANKVAFDASTSLVMDNVLWENIDPSQFLTVLSIKKNGGTLNLKGRVSLPAATVETVEAIRDIFGDTAFLPTSEFFVEIPESLILEGPSRVVNGKSGTFVATPIPVAVSSPTYAMIVNGEEVNAIAGVATLDANTGVLSVNADLAADTSVVVRAKFLGRNNTYIYSNEVTVAVEIEVRPTSININGDASVYYKDYEHTYTLGITPNNVNVGYTVAWSLSDSDNVSIVSQDNDSCVIKVLNELTGSSRKYTLTAVLTTFDGAEVLTASKDITLEQVVRPTSLVFDEANGEIQFAGNYTYVATPNITPINVDVTYGTPTLSGTAVSQGKVSLVSASNGQVVIAVSSESTTDLYFTIKQTATVGGNGATIEGVREVTLKNVVRPTSMSIEGATTITGNAYEYNAVLTPSTSNVPMNYVWSISGSSSATIQSTDGVTCVVLADVPEEDEAFTLSCTATSTDGKTTVSATLNGTVLTKPSYIVATYDVTSTSSATKLMYDVYTVTYMEIDGAEVAPVSSYTFSSAGHHTVKFSRKDISQCFSGASNLISVDFSLFDGASQMSLGDFVYNCAKLTSIEWGGCTLPKVTSLSSTFYNCSALASIDLTPLAGAPIKSLGSAFYGCTALTSLDLSPLTGAPITYFGYTFVGCSKLTSIEWGGCTLPKVTSLDTTFSSCSALTSLDLSPLTGAPITTLVSAFYGCKALTSIDLTPLAGAPITTLNNTFYNCSALASIDLTPLAGAPIKSLGSAFRGCTALTSLDLSPLTGAPIKSLSSAFRGCSKLTSIEWGGCTLPKVTSLSSTFRDCSALTSIDLTPLAGAPITDLDTTFSSCSALTSLDLSPLTGAPITTLASAFERCSALTSLDLSPLTGAPITTLTSTFYYCSALTSIDLTPLAGAPITNLSNTFYRTISLKSIKVGWLTAPVVSMTTFGESSYSYTGRNTYSTGKNMLIVPTGATGYDEGYWGSVLLDSTKCGFRIVQNGVYIQHVDGGLYTGDEWTAGGFANDAANGVAVISEDATFVIAKKDASSYTLRWGGKGKTITSIVTSDDGSAAVLDYDGAGNTSKIIEQLNGYDDGISLGAPAAKYCKAYIFPNGKEGYLPSIGEWKTANNNRAAIDSAISLIGGAAINTNSYYSSSTQCNSESNWGIYWNGGYLNRNDKNSKYYVRAFTTL